MYIYYLYKRRILHLQYLIEPYIILIYVWSTYYTQKHPKNEGYTRFCLFVLYLFIYIHLYGIYFTVYRALDSVIRVSNKQSTY